MYIYFSEKEATMVNFWLIVCTALLGTLCLPLMWYHDHRVMPWNKTKFRFWVVMPVIMIIIAASNYLVPYLLGRSQVIMGGIPIAALALFMIDIMGYLIVRHVYRDRQAVREKQQRLVRRFGKNVSR